MFQSVCITEEAMRWSLRFFSRRSPWLRHGTMVRGRSFPSQHSWSTTRSGTGLCRTVVGPVRFYSQEGVHSEEELEGKEHLSPQEDRKSPFMENLQLCRSPSDVLDLSCHGHLTVQQISRCLTQMSVICKTLSEEQWIHEKRLMFKHPGFEKLLQEAMQNVGEMTNQEVAYTLLGIVKLGVPQNSRVIQTFLRHCQEKLNDFDEICLSLVASSLERMDDSPNIRVLKDGLRMVLEARLPTIKKVLPLQITMRLLGKDASLPLKRKLERKALSLSDNFSFHNCHHMITTMAQIGFYSKPLLDVCSKKISESIIGIPFGRLFVVLRSCRELQYRNLELFTALSDYITSMINIWPTMQILYFLSSFEKLMFCPTALMKAFAEKVIENPDALTLPNIMCLLKVYAHLNCDLQHRRQPFLDSLTRVLDACLPTMSSYDALQSAYYMSLMDHFPPAILEKLLQSSTLEELRAPKYLRNHKRLFQAVHMSLRVDRPDLPLPLAAPPSFLEDSAPCSPPVKQWLSQTLESVLKDHAGAVLQEAVMVENHYAVDAVITIHSANQTETKESTAATEEHSPAESSQRIAIVCSPYFGYCYGSTNPCGTLAVKIRHLRILGYNPVLLNQHELLSMPEDERTDVLRGQIFPGHLGTDEQAKVEQLGSSGQVAARNGNQELHPIQSSQ